MLEIKKHLSKEKKSYKKKTERQVQDLKKKLPNSDTWLSICLLVIHLFLKQSFILFKASVSIEIKNKNQNQRRMLKERKKTSKKYQKQIKTDECILFVGFTVNIISFNSLRFSSYFFVSILNAICV